MFIPSGGIAILSRVIARLVLLVLMAALPAAAQDYAREKRWADEVVPGLVVGDALWLETAAGRRFLAIHAPAAKPRGAVVLVHGIGVHPDYGVVGMLRSKLADQGWTTLSIQMPVQAADARSDLVIEGHLSASPDHPASLNFPEGEYLKGLLLRSVA